MLDWTIVITSVLGVVSAIAYIVKAVHSIDKQEAKSKHVDHLHKVQEAEELKALIKEINKFQKVAHDFPNTKTVDHNNLALPLNCKNCGAPLHGHICKFCDTEYRY